jgi:hypothetical protein
MPSTASNVTILPLLQIKDEVYMKAVISKVKAIGTKATKAFLQEPHNTDSKAATITFPEEFKFTRELFLKLNELPDDDSDGPIPEDANL